MIEYTQIELRIMALFSAIGAAFSFLVGGVDKLITALLICDRINCGVEDGYAQ